MTQRLLSDALGRERAIRIVRGILDRDQQVNNDGRAVMIVVALDHALDPEWEVTEYEVGVRQFRPTRLRPPGA